MSKLLAAALNYAARGLPVFPVVPRGKTPAVARGFRAATTIPATIRRFWTNPSSNVGIPTGASSAFWVLDIDGEEGEANLGALEREHGAIPKTRIVLTSRGRHVHFAYPGSIPSSAGRIAPGIDVRADSAYIIVPPSIHESGHVYTWADDPQPPLASAPTWLVILARTRPMKLISEKALATIRPPHGYRPHAYGQAALRDEIAMLAATPRGSRNHALNRSSFCLFQLVASGELSEAEVIEGLRQACLANGLAADDGWNTVRLTIRSGARAGLQHPRRAP
jgi:putative DNA primase/helicase